MTLFSMAETSVFRFGISSGLNEASRSLGTSISSVPELVLTVFLPYPFLLLSENCQNQLRYTRYRCSKRPDRKSTRLNSSHVSSSYAVFCLQKNNRAGRRVQPGAGDVEAPGPHHAGADGRQQRVAAAGERDVADPLAVAEQPEAAAGGAGRS